MDKLGDIDKDPDYAQKLETAKQNVLRKCKNTNYKRTIPVIETGFDKVLSDIEESPQHSREAILQLHMASARQCSLYVASTEVEKMNNQLAKFQLD